jgi:hypothetical protein
MAEQEARLISPTGVDPDYEIAALRREIRGLNPKFDTREIARLRSRLAYWRRRRRLLRAKA